MIFVTVGNARQPFRRLIDAMVKLHESSALHGEELIIQHGHTPMNPLREISATPFMANIDFEETLRRADVVVCHGGCGTLLMCARNRRVPVVVPRSKRYHEHVNDHQNELAIELERQGKVILCDDLDRLFESIQKSRSAVWPVEAGASQLPRLVGDAIRQLVAD